MPEGEFRLSRMECIAMAEIFSFTGRSISADVILKRDEAGRLIQRWPNGHNWYKVVPPRRKVAV